MSAWSAKRCGVKSIGIANQYSLISEKTPKVKGFFSLKFIRNFAPCSEYIALSYEKFDDFIYQPFISDYFLKSEVNDRKFFLIYLPSYNLDYILNQLSEFKQYKWRVYSNEEHSNELKNIKVIKLNKDKFQKDLTNCSGVITASGFSTTSEALVLGKKLWSIPIKGQFEQIDNATKLNKLGVYTDDLTSENLENWLNNYIKVDYKWINPIESIISKIKEIYES